MNVISIEKEKIFNPLISDKETHIMIRIGTKCAYNCSNCNLSNDLPYKNTYLNISNLETVIEKISILFCKDFYLKFYGTNCLKHNDIIKILKISNKYGFKGIIIQDYVDDLNNLNILKKIASNLSMNPIIHLFKNVENIDEIKILKIIENYGVYMGSNSVLFFGLSSFKNNLTPIKALINNYKKNILEIKKEVIRFKVKNINLIIGKIVPTIIDHEKKEIINLNYNKCTLNDNIKLDNNKVYIKDEIEVDLKGNIFFHYNEFCYKSKKYICNVNDNFAEIIDSMDIFKKFLLKKTNIDAKKACYECIN